MIMGSLLSWIVSEKLSEGLLGPPSCKIDSFFFLVSKVPVLFIILHIIQKRVSVHLLQQKKKNSSLCSWYRL